jgi:hypothetical protein
MADVAFVANEVRDGERAQAFQEAVREALETETGLWWVWLFPSDPADPASVTVWLKFHGRPVYLARRPEGPITIRGLREEDWLIEGVEDVEGLRRSIATLLNRHR